MRLDDLGAEELEINREERQRDGDHDTVDDIDRELDYINSHYIDMEEDW